MSAQAARYNRLRWKCRRGMIELDTLLLRYLEDCYSGAASQQQEAFERILEMPDPQLYFLIMGRTESDNREVADLVNVLRNLPRH